MFRTFCIATLLATLPVAACKKSEKPADPAASKQAEPAKAAQPAPKPPTLGSDSTDSAEPAKPAEAPKAGSDWEKPVEAPKPDEAGQNSELEAKGVTMMQQLGEVFAADAKDCEKLATDIKAFVTQNKPLLGELVAMQKSATPQQKAAFATRNAAVQTALAAKMQPAIAACAQNPSVQAAMKTFPNE